MSLNLITLRRAAGMTNVKMAGEKHVSAAFRQPGHRHLRAANQIAIIVAAGEIERMMRHQNLDDVIRQRAKPFRYPRKLQSINATALYYQRARGAHANYNHLVVGKRRLKVWRDVTPEFVQGAKEPVVNVIERHVMIPRDDNLWLRELVEECARLLKLARARPLRQVA